MKGSDTMGPRETGSQQFTESAPTETCSHSPMSPRSLRQSKEEESEIKRLKLEIARLKKRYDQAEEACAEEKEELIVALRESDERALQLVEILKEIHLFATSYKEVRI